MSWIPDIDMLKAYILVMTDEQYERFEDIVLGLKDPSCFTMREVRDLEIKLNERKLKNDKEGKNVWE
jgi:hypothetical protein